jgi:pimeloyl-ACP methyl ester carboxylesterase
LDEQAVLIDGFMQEMGIAKAIIIGHGLGAVVAMLFAVQHQRNVDRLMCVGLPGVRQGINPRLFHSPAGELIDWLLGRSPDGDAVRMETPKADPAALETALKNMLSVDVVELYSNLNLPCLLVQGLQDTLTDAALAQNQLPECVHQIIFERSGHFPMLDEPSKFNRLLSDFLSLTSGESPRLLQLKDEWRRRVR